MKNSNQVPSDCKERNAQLFKKIALGTLLVCTCVSYSQTKAQKMPGSENYDSVCAIVYSNAYQDGFACASGNKALCGYYPTSKTECETANREGYNEGYRAANAFKEVNNNSGLGKRVSEIWRDFLKTLKLGA